MSEFTKRVKLLSLLFILFAVLTIKSQSLGITVNNGVNYQCDMYGNNIVNASVTSTVAGTTSYSWTVTSPACVPSYSATPGNAIISIAATCVGFYSICCTAYNGTAVVGFQCSTFNIYPNPTVTISNIGPSTVCAGTGYTLSGSGAISYTWVTQFMPIYGATLIDYPTSSSCYTLIGQNSQGCVSTATQCSNVLPAPSITVAGNNTVCLGSSTSFTASGASTYTWSAGSTGSTYSVLPLIGTSYTVAGTDANGCIGNTSFLLVVDTTCADVWPGDANSDGVVDNTDVFELGLAFNDTGSPRSPGGNAYTSQYASAWTGYVSTGKNKCHADCNGDGTVNLDDTLAIFNNYSLSHAFKSSEASSASGDINFGTLLGNTVFTGTWNKVDILLGSNANAISQLYGVAFNVNYDYSLIDISSPYIVYTNSFLSLGNQNIQFRKTDYINAKVYAASVRTDGNNVNGFGKIGEFWFFVKFGASPMATLNLSISNVRSINKNGLITPLTGSSSAYLVTTILDGTGVNEQNLLEQATQLFPNPATNQLTLQCSLRGKISYIISDIVGREVAHGGFTGTKTLDVSELENGNYFVRFQSEGNTSYKKLVIGK